MLGKGAGGQGAIVTRLRFKMCKILITIIHIGVICIVLGLTLCKSQVIHPALSPSMWRQGHKFIEMSWDKLERESLMVAILISRQFKEDSCFDLCKETSNCGGVYIKVFHWWQLRNWWHRYIGRYKIMFYCSLALVIWSQRIRHWLARLIRTQMPQAIGLNSFLRSVFSQVHLWKCTFWIWKVHGWRKYNKKYFIV